MRDQAASNHRPKPAPTNSTGTDLKPWIHPLHPTNQARLALPTKKRAKQIIYRVIQTKGKC